MTPEAYLKCLWEHSRWFLVPVAFVATLALGVVVVGGPEELSGTRTGAWIVAVPIILIGTFFGWALVPYFCLFGFLMLKPVWLRLKNAGMSEHRRSLYLLLVALAWGLPIVSLLVGGLIRFPIPFEFSFAAFLAACALLVYPGFLSGPDQTPALPGNDVSRHKFSNQSRSNKNTFGKRN